MFLQFLYTNGNLVIFRNRSLSSLKNDINRNADVSTDVPQSSSIIVYLFDIICDQRLLMK